MGNHNLQQNQKSEVGSPHYIYIYFIIQYRWNHGFSTKLLGRDRNFLTFCGVTQVPFCCKGCSLGQWLDWGPPHVDEVRVRAKSTNTCVFRCVFPFGGEGIEGHGRLDSWKGSCLKMLTSNDQDGLRMNFVVVPSEWSDIIEWFWPHPKSKLKMLQNMILNLLDFVKDHSPR